MAKSSSSARWKQRQARDPFVKRAQAEGWRSRAVFKLSELQGRERLIAPGQVVVDLGAAPGAWSQFARSVVGARGRVLAVDLLPMPAVPGVDFLQGDFREPEVLEQLEGALQGRPVDVVVSDMAPNLSGIASSDAARITHLVELAVDFARAHLRPEGALVVKLFHGGGYTELVQLFRDTFHTVKPVKPKASRDKSSETFLVGIGLKKGV